MLEETKKNLIKIILINCRWENLTFKNETGKIVKKLKNVVNKEIKKVRRVDHNQIIKVEVEEIPKIKIKNKKIIAIIRKIVTILHQNQDHTVNLNHPAKIIILLFP